MESGIPEEDTWGGMWSKFMWCWKKRITETPEGVKVRVGRIEAKKFCVRNFVVNGSRLKNVEKTDRHIEGLYPKLRW